MIKVTDISAPLDYASDFPSQSAAAVLGMKPEDFLGVRVLKRSIDARRKYDIHYILTVGVEAEDESGILEKHKGDKRISPVEPLYAPEYHYDKTRKRPVVVGLGPAGLFAALTLAKAGAEPIVLERGRSIEERSKLVNGFWHGGELDEDCNVQFGEGGAGAFSDGKLATGIKDPRIGYVFKEFVECGAPEEILYNAKPHIGTNRLTATVAGMREKIKRLGGTIIYGARFCDFDMKNAALSAVYYMKDSQKCRIETDSLLLCVGHSARDVFSLLCDKQVGMTQKSFAVGVRIEHPCEMIDNAMYGIAAGKYNLGAADYKLAVHLPGGRGVFSFCMCPGGYVVAAASERGGVVTNGMSNFARDAKNSNSALLVGINPQDFESRHPLAGVELQRTIERAAFEAGGGNYFAPVCTVGEFLKNREPSPDRQLMPSYLPGTSPALPSRYLPDFICDALKRAIPMMARRLRGFDMPDALLTGVESRSSCPVRIDRGSNFQSVTHMGIYPCAEGAGYAGGITSSAVDGIKCAEAIINKK